MKIAYRGNFITINIPANEGQPILVRGEDGNEYLLYHPNNLNKE